MQLVGFGSYAVGLDIFRWRLRITNKPLGDGTYGCVSLGLYGRPYAIGKVLILQDVTGFPTLMGSDTRAMGYCGGRY